MRIVPHLHPLVLAGSLLCTTACTPAAPDTAAAESASPATAADPAAERAKALASAFTAFDIAPAPPGTLAVHGSWHLVADSSSTPRVYLMHRITAITLPPGPVTATEPVGLFQYADGGWRMLPPIPPAPTVPDHIIGTLAPSLTDKDRTYAFLVRTFDVTTDSSDVATRLRIVRLAMEKQSAAILARGFVSADAEP